MRLWECACITAGTAVDRIWGSRPQAPLKLKMARQRRGRAREASRLIRRGAHFSEKT
jgi:hypothetical protein